MVYGYSHISLPLWIAGLSCIRNLARRDPKLSVVWLGMAYRMHPHCRRRMLGLMLGMLPWPVSMLRRRSEKGGEADAVSA